MTKVVRRSLLALLSMVFLALPYSAGLAEGIKRYQPRLAQAAPAAPVDEGYKWTGFYLGGGAGHVWSNEGRVDGTPQVDETPQYEIYNGDNNFFFGELKAGYDAQLGNNFVVGVFGTWSPNVLLGTSVVDDIYSVGARLGYGGPNLLVYVGGAWVRMEAADITLDGWAGLAGFEMPLFNTQSLNLTWGLEYKYQDVEGSSGFLAGDDISHTAMARVNIRLGAFGSGR